MMTAQLEVSLGGTQWILDYRKAAYLPAHKLLLLSDVHLGKVQHFRKNGIAVPAQVASQNLSLMQSLLTDYQATTVLFLGDLFHSRDNAEHQLLEQMHQSFPQVQLLLVPGNHDESMLQQLPAFLQLTKPSHQLGNMLFSHHPPPSFQKHYFHCYGHLHPAVEVRGKARQRMKFPAFLFTANALVMPAFGQFTGSVAANNHLPQARQLLCTPEGLWLVENHKFS
jgi:uncharacterized protein